ncbi:hypothetical protein ACNQQP_31820, partial [Pseudomonas aeruginosa]
LRHDPLQARQDLDVPRVVNGQRIAHPRAVENLDTGEEEAHLARLPADAEDDVETTDLAAVGSLISMPEFVEVIVGVVVKGQIELISREA